MCKVVMDAITFPENLQSTSGLSILLHGVISLPDAALYDKKIFTQLAEHLSEPVQVSPLLAMVIKFTLRLRLRLHNSCCAYFKFSN